MCTITVAQTMPGLNNKMNNAVCGEHILIHLNLCAEMKLHIPYT